ncbi:phage major tail tube protein [Peptoniphilus sp. EMRHCC_23]|uniref:phage major tail tube protein n=1 Tax=Peptoniphilus rachelemmaiella TaxID=2811779 RepID=UPI001C001B98|nr:phage major tail tube protein [Peptoniphilus rachelemmaiella]
MKNIPDKLVNFRVYQDNAPLFNADVELPSLEYMTETLSGSGFAGEMETPTIGHFSSMSIKFNLRTLPTNAYVGLLPTGTMWEVRGSLQQLDKATAKISAYPCLLTVVVLPKTTELGKFEVGATTDTSIEGEVAYMRLVVDNEELVEIDKANFICNIHGKDYLEEVRTHLGM